MARVRVGDEHCVAYRGQGRALEPELLLIFARPNAVPRRSATISSRSRVSWENSSFPSGIELDFADDLALVLKSDDRTSPETMAASCRGGACSRRFVQIEHHRVPVIARGASRSCDLPYEILGSARVPCTRCRAAGQGE